MLEKPSLFLLPWGRIETIKSVKLVSVKYPQKVIFQLYVCVTFDQGFHKKEAEEVSLLPQLKAHSSTAAMRGQFPPHTNCE